MKERDTFFLSSSIHGVRYLASKYGKFRQIIFGIAIFGAFSICSVIVWENIQENRNDPTATKVFRRTLSNFPFPAITIKNRPQHFEQYLKLSQYVLLENVLNYFPLDCTAQEHYEKLNLTAAKICLDKTEPLRAYISTVFDELFPTLIAKAKDSLTVDEGFYNLSNRLVCNNHFIVGAKKLTSLFAKMLNSNNSFHLEKQLISLFKISFLKPFALSRPHIEAKLEQVFIKDFDQPQPVKRCKERLRGANPETIKVIMSFLLLLVNPLTNSAPLGTLLKIAPQHEKVQHVNEILHKKAEILLENRFYTENRTRLCWSGLSSVVYGCACFFKKCGKNFAPIRNAAKQFRNLT
jgi:hypothetical protein